MNATKILDNAICFAAERWQQCLANGAFPSNLNLRDQVTFFAKPFRKSLLKKFPTLRPATDQVLLLVIAEGIAQSDTVPREKVEAALGIILPPPN